MQTFDTTHSPHNSTEHPLHGASKAWILAQLFYQFAKIAIFVVGGGYAIIIAADDIFGRRLKWLREGELFGMLPVFQTVPGLIAGNSAMYVGWRMAGVAGAIVSLVGVVLPSFLIITFVAMGFDRLPMDNVYVQGAFMGVRSALAGIVLGTLIKAWPGVMKGAYAYIAAPLYFALILFVGIRAGYVLIASILFGMASIALVLPAYRKFAGKERTP